MPRMQPPRIEDNASPKQRFVFASGAAGGMLNPRESGRDPMNEPQATSDTRSDDPLLRAAAAAAGSPPGSPPQSPIDDDALPHLRIGRYQIKRQIGAGGMGVVYEAVHEELGQSAALKLMKHRAATPEALQRFIREARVLANCHHANIAQVYDAGTHRHGGQEIPYYVLEFVRGARVITDWANEKGLTTDERLDLFARVCDALHAVHERGVVHRDIKPDNVLVDGAGQPKVIDFGVARVLSADLPLPALQTRGENLVGTLQYMSPEQVGPEAADVDRRGDVYALGLLLYELLCGRRPYELGGMTLDEAVRTIRELPPAPPRLANPGLDEDVETILLKALHKDRDRRYPSAAAMATSIRHRLANEPIPDRRDSATYVLRRQAGALVGAHRVTTWLLVTAASLLLAINVGRLLRAWTPLDRLFERTVTTRVQPAGAAPFSKVRMVALRDGRDLKALATSLGLSGVDPTHRVTLRLLHAELMKRLVRSGARVVAFDIQFGKPTGGSEECPYENEMLTGIRVLRQAGVEVVLAAGPRWDIGEEDLPAGVCTALAREAHWGFISADLFPDASWALDLMFQPIDRPPMPSLSLAACAAYWRPGRFHWVNFDYDPQTLARYARISYVRPGAARPRAWAAPAEAYFDRVRLSVLGQATKDMPEFGRARGDWVGQYYLQIARPHEIDEATIDFADVFAADETKLRGWFDGRVVVVGDARVEGRDGPFRTPDGRLYPGFVAHALGIDSMLTSNSILAPFRIDLPGINVPSDLVYAAVATMAGALLAVILPRPAWRRRALTALLAAVLCLASVMMYREGRVLHDPLVPVLGLIFAAEGVALLEGVWRGRAAQPRPRGHPSTAGAS
jgi:CHASE2 domain-containing sensor protein